MAGVKSKFTVKFEPPIEQLMKRFRVAADKLPEGIEQAGIQLMRDEMLGMFNRTVASWSNPPKAHVKHKKQKGEQWFNVEVRDARWHYLNEGVRAHPICPRRKGFLAFQEHYLAKTHVGSLDSGPGGPAGEWVFTKRCVQHPGIPARKWSDMMRRELQKLAPSRVLAQLQKWISQYLLRGT